MTDGTTVRSVSSKICFHAIIIIIDNAMLQNNNYLFMVLVVCLSSYGCPWEITKHSVTIVSHYIVLLLHFFHAWQPPACIQNLMYTQ